MKALPAYPSLYQINSRIWLTELSRTLGTCATLDDIPDAELAHLRQRLQKRGLKLMLDFVPNHMAPDYTWAEQHPDFFVHGSDDDLARAPQNYRRYETSQGSVVLAGFCPDKGMRGEGWEL